MTLASWDEAARHLAARFSLERLSADRGRFTVPTDDGAGVVLEANMRNRQGTSWLCVGGIVGPARFADPAALVAANARRIVGVFEVTREGDVWLRHSLLLGELRATDVDSVIGELTAELAGRRAQGA